MKALSEQLSALSDRAKQTEDVVAVAREKNRAKLQDQQAKLKTSIDAGQAKAKESGAAAKGKADTWLSDTRSSVNQRFAKMHDQADQRRADRDVKKAEHQAEQAEHDAADAIDLALYVLEQAEYAVVDAAIARADADDLAGKR